MKSYREIADSVFERRDKYVIAQRKKKQAITRVTASVGSVALVSLASIALFKNEVFHETPPIKLTTTVTHSPVTEGTTDTTALSATIDSAESTAGDIQPTQTEPIVAPSKPTATQTKPTVTQSKPTVTQTKPTTPTQTEPTKTTPTTSEKVVIAANKADNTGIGDNVAMSKYKKYISKLLKEMMTMYEGEDVVYAVIVNIPCMEEYSDDFWNSKEEWARLIQERDEVYDAYYEETKSLNPSWNGSSTSDIEIWTDTMRANYERYISLIREAESVYWEHHLSYYEMVERQQIEALKAVSSTEPIDILLEDSHLFFRAYYVELTADAINALVERGGYRLCLATYDDMKNNMFDA